MATFTLKARDTRPILEVALTNPDGSAHDLTGSTAWALHVRISSTLVVTRALVKQGLDTAGVLRYTWLDADWNDTTGLPIVTTDRVREFPMEYEVTGGPDGRMTFPNDVYDILQIRGDVV